ncbi:MAG: GNAT family N-acetyltransferase [Rhodopila sp.]
MASEATSAGSTDLQPGEMVQVRPADEIKAMLARNSWNNGLAFESEMLQCSGGTYLVVGHVRRLIDGRTAEMVQFRNDCIILEESRRTQINADVRRFGRLSPYFYWDRTWLCRAGEAGFTNGHAATACFSGQPIRITQRFDVSVSYDPSVVAGVWEALEPEGTVFQTRAWLLPLYRIVAPKFHMAPLFVTVSDRSSSRPIMLLPLCIGRKSGLTVIEFADFGITDYNAPLVSPALTLNTAEAQDLWDDICHALPPADIVLLDKMPEMVSGRPVPLAQLRWVRRMDMRAWAVTLPQTRDEYDRIILKPKDRKEQRRKRRNLVEWLGDLTLVHAETEIERRTFFEALKQQREARCKKAGYQDLLLDPTFLRFYQAVAYGESGPVGTLSALKAQDRIVATLFALTHNNNYLLVGNCSPPFRKHRNHVYQRVKHPDRQ